MSVDTLHGLYGIKIDSTLVGGIMSQDIELNSDVRNEPSSAEPYPRIQTLNAQNPVVRFSTMAVSAALGVAGLPGTSIAGLTSKLTLYGQKYADGGTRAGESSHRTFTINKGIIVPRTLSADHQGDAVLTYDALVTYDGTNNPIVLADSQSLPSGITDAERFTLGPATVSNIAIDHIKSLNIDFGVNAVAEGGDSDIWPTIATVRTQMAKITIRTVDILQFKESGGIPHIGVAATHANSILYLRKRAAGGTFVADGTSAHIKLATAGMTTIKPFTASGAEPGEVEITITCGYDGTNLPIAVTTGSAIS